MQRAAVALVIVLLPGVLLAPAWRLGGLSAGAEDGRPHYAARVFFHETVRAGHWPWIDPSGGLDCPYAADPHSALWYPPTWLFVVLPPLWAHAASLWAHYSIALWGAYRLLRGNKLDRRAALFGGAAFAVCGFMLAHRADFTLQHAAAWTPWVFWRMQRYARPAEQADGRGSSNGMGRLAAVSVVGALQCLAGHLQIAAITATGCLVYLLAQRGASPGTDAGTGNTARKAVAARWLIAGVCVAGLFAVQWLPMLAYRQVCARADRTYREFVEHSWHPTSAIGWVLPMFHGQRTPNFFDQPYWGPSRQSEQFVYAGVLPLLLAAVGLRAGWRSDRRRRPWIILAGFGLVLALGKFGPISPLIYWIPGSSLFRDPAHGLLLCSLAIAALAAVTLHDLGAVPTPRRAQLRAAALRWTRRPLLKGLLLIAVPLCLVAAALPLVPTETRRAALWALRPWNPAVVVPLVIAILGFAALGFVARRWRQPGWLWLLVGLTALDLAVIGWTLDAPAAPEVVATTPADWHPYDSPPAGGMAFFEDPTQPGAVRYVERGPAWFLTVVDTWPTEAGSESPDSTPADAGWPRVIVSRLALPGWGARVDGAEYAVETAHEGLLAIRVPPGRVVEIEWAYFPPGLREGVLITAISAAVLIALAALSHRKRDTTTAREAPRQQV